MTLLVAGYLFVLGAIFGSFALVVVDRMHAKQDWVRGRSRCAFCKHTLGVVDLVPVVSWLSTGGRCRYCRKKLSRTYPLTEIGLAVVFVLSFFAWPVTLQGGTQISLFVLWLAGMVVATVLFVYDLRWLVLPSSVTNALIGIAAVHRIIVIHTNDISLTSDVWNTLLTLLASSGFFYLLYKVSKGAWIGDGDIFLGIAIGLFLAGPFEAWFAVCVASVVGIIVAFPKLIRSRRNLKMRLPFGPLLLVGLFVAYFCANRILDWYVERFLYIR